MRRSGQLALIAVIILAGTLLALVSIRTPNPYVAYERGHLQAAQLIHLARACFSGSCTPERVRALLSVMVSVNRSEPLRMYPVPDAFWIERMEERGWKGNPKNWTEPKRTGGGWVTEYSLNFTILTPAGGEKVTYYARIESLGVEGTYTKTAIVGGTLQTLTMVRVGLRYTNSYATPFFNATVCPRLSDPAGVADLLSFNPSTCEWVVGVPRELSVEARFGSPPARVYKLRDEWNVFVPVYHAGG